MPSFEPTRMHTYVFFEIKIEVQAGELEDCGERGLFFILDLIVGGIIEGNIRREGVPTDEKKGNCLSLTQQINFKEYCLL